MDDLLGSVYDTLETHEEETQLSRHMYRGSREKESKNPVHDIFSDLIRKEWAEPDKSIFLQFLKKEIPL